MSKRTMTGQGIFGPTGVVSSSFPRRRLVLTPSMVATRGRIARYKGTISRGYTRRAGFYGRFNMGRDSAGELKFLDTSVDDTLIASAGQITESVNIIPQGVTESERIGRKATIRDIIWHYQLRLAERDAVGTPGVPDIVRLIMYQDKQTNGAAATLAQILSTATINSFYNLENKGRFRILMDRQHDLNYTNMASDGAGVVSNSRVFKHFSFVKKVSIPIEFDNSASTGAVTTMRSNNIGVLALSVSGTSTQLISNVRIRFSDGSA